MYKRQFRDRRNKKRNFRALWIQRINAAARLEGMSYSKLMGGLHKAGIETNRKVLADLAVNHPEAFKDVYKRQFVGWQELSRINTMVQLRIIKKRSTLIRRILLFGTI